MQIKSSFIHVERIKSCPTVTGVGAPAQKKIIGAGGTLHLVLGDSPRPNPPSGRLINVDFHQDLQHGMFILPGDTLSVRDGQTDTNSSHSISMSDMCIAQRRLNNSTFKIR